VQRAHNIIFPFYRGELPEVQRRRRYRAHRTRAPHIYKLLGTGGTVSRRTANKKLTKLYCPSRKRSQNRLTALEESKKLRGTTKNSALLNSFQRHCSSMKPTAANDVVTPSQRVDTTGWTYVNARSANTGNVNSPHISATMPRFPMISYNAPVSK